MFSTARVAALYGDRMLNKDDGNGAVDGALEVGDILIDCVSNSGGDTVIKKTLLSSRLTPELMFKRCRQENCQ